VITVDVELSQETERAIREHPLGRLVETVKGDSKDPAVVDRVRSLVGSERRVLVFLDSDHSRDHVLEELRAYAPLVPPGGYLVAFDTICRWLAGCEGAREEWARDNPLAAVDLFLRENRDFSRDRSREKLLVSFGTGGFLRRRGGES
jgi:cephalosporin hydroxylase